MSHTSIRGTQKISHAFLVMLFLAAVLSGCGGNSMKPIAASPFTVAFGSTGALDGSNSPNTNTTSNIWVAKSDGSSAVPLTRLTSLSSNAVEPIWSPDGTKIAFSSSRALDGSDAGNNAFNLWVMNADGSAAAPITHFTSSGITIAEKVWSPDGSKLAFSSTLALNGSDALNTNGTVNIWTINANGANLLPLTHLTVNPSQLGVWTNQQTVWSPDSTRVVFLSAANLAGTNALNTNEVFNLWIAKADGSSTIPLTSLSSANVFQAYPAWSPDGKKVAFVAARALDGSDAPSPAGAVNLWVINADGSSATPLTRFSSGLFMFYPAWSPDGSKLAFGSDQAINGTDAINNADNVWVINADGTGAMPLSRLTVSGVSFVLPMSWSPDSMKVVFTSQRALDGSDAANPSGGTNIWLLNADGSGSMPLTKFTASSAEGFSPAVKP